MLAPNRPDVLDEVFDGEAVLVDLRTGRYYALDAAATRSGARWWPASRSPRLRRVRAPARGGGAGGRDGALPEPDGEGGRR